MGKTKTSPFASLVGTPSAAVPVEPVEAVPQVLQHRPSTAQRDRRWEQQNKVTGYRGIPPELNDELKALAEELSVPLGDVVRALLEYGLAAHKRGDLTLKPHLRIGKMTLFPSRESAK
jgi:hypothetical protein